MGQVFAVENTPSLLSHTVAFSEVLLSIIIHGLSYDKKTLRQLRFMCRITKIIQLTSLK